MADKTTQETSQFGLVLDGFQSYVATIVNAIVPQIQDPEDRTAAQALGATASHISSTFSADARSLYASQDGDVQARFDTAAKQLGGAELAGNMIRASENARARGGFWRNFIKIFEAIKKIIKDILSVSLFGVSLSDLIGGIGINVDEIFRVLDNIIQTIAGLFGGEKVAQDMRETELNNLKVETAVAALQRTKFLPGQIQA